MEFHSIRSASLGQPQWVTPGATATLAVNGPGVLVFTATPLRVTLDEQEKLQSTPLHVPLAEALERLRQADNSSAAPRDPPLQPGPSVSTQPPSSFPGKPPRDAARPQPQQAPSHPQWQPSCPAHTLAAAERRQLALQALAGSQPVAHLAEQAQVSRKFIYQQKAKADQALQDAFPPPDPATEPVLFHLPVTHSWLCQFILSTVLNGHSSLRGVTEILRDVFDYPLSHGTVANVLHSAVLRAHGYNQSQDLARIRIAALDEIFQAHQPVLVGADAASTYCFLLSLEKQRDADTWGIRLLECQDRGLAPDAFIADAGSGLRAGQQEAYGAATPCWGDNFHALREVQTVVTFVENRAYEAIAARSKLEHQQRQHRRRKGRADRSRAQKLRHARVAEPPAVALADDLRCLYQWLQQDILSLSGPEHATREQLYDFVVAELRARLDLCPHRLKPLVTLLVNQKQDLLAFAARLDQDLADVAADFAVAPAVARAMLHLQALPWTQPQRWTSETALRPQLGRRFDLLRNAVAAVAERTVRASSLIENYNSRLRTYFFLRKQLGPDYLALLQFFLNHRRFLRSEHPERVGQSPAELLTGQAHPHWLEMLGYQRFQRN